MRLEPKRALRMMEMTNLHHLTSLLEENGRPIGDYS